MTKKKKRISLDAPQLIKNMIEQLLELVYQKRGQMFSSILEGAI